MLSRLDHQTPSMVSLHPMPLDLLLDELKEQVLVPEGDPSRLFLSPLSRVKASHCSAWIIALIEGYQMILIVPQNYSLINYP